MSDGPTVARPYAEALFKLSSKEDKTFGQELKFLSVILRDSNLKTFVSNPTVSRDEIKKLLLSLLPPDFNKNLKHFLELLAENSRLNFFEDILEQFHKLENEHNKVLDAKICSAFELVEEQQVSIKDKLEKKFRKKVVLSCVVDKNLIGGIKIIIGDHVIDGSIKRNLEVLKNSILTS